MKQRFKWILGALSGVAITAGAFFAGRAWAGGIPTTGALTYSGTLQNADGSAVTGSHGIEVELWNAATAGKALCDVKKSNVSLSGGRFSITLTDDCATGIHSTTTVWAEIFVDSNSLGRVPLGVVPYALEAGHATAADTATSATSATNATNAGHATNADNATTAAGATGALQTTLTGLSKAVVAVDGLELHSTDSDVHMAGCVANPNLINCTVGANRKCQASGYRGGWFVGESNSDGSLRTITCIK